MKVAWTLIYYYYLVFGMARCGGCRRATDDDDDDGSGFRCLIMLMLMLMLMMEYWWKIDVDGNIAIIALTAAPLTRVPQERCERESCRYFHPPPHLQARVKANQLNASSLMAAAAQSQALALVSSTLYFFTRARARRGPDRALLLAHPHTFSITSWLTWVTKYVF